MTHRSRRIASGVHPHPDILGPLSEWQAAVVRLQHLDPVTTELVRMRCAVYHDCHT
ncbi:MAG: hypothetical protein ACO3U0_00710 [Ilumatobacteraceae bacterium]